MKPLIHRTKIVATIGPASSSPEVLRRMLLAGMNVARLNFSHGSYEDHGKMRRISHIGIWSVLTVALVLGTCLADEESGEKHTLYLRRPARVRFVMLLNFQ